MPIAPNSRCLSLRMMQYTYFRPSGVTPVLAASLDVTCKSAMTDSSRKAVEVACATVERAWEARPGVGPGEYTGGYIDEPHAFAGPALGTGMSASGPGSVRS